MFGKMSLLWMVHIKTGMVCVAAEGPDTVEGAEEVAQESAVSAALVELAQVMRTTQTIQQIIPRYLVDPENSIILGFSKD